MKKRKIKLLASLTSLILVVAVMSVGVWAATQATLTINTSAAFTATGIKGTLTLKASSDDRVLVGTTSAGSAIVDTVLLDVALADTNNNSTDKTAATLNLFLGFTAATNGIITSTGGDVLKVVYTLTNSGENDIKYTLTWTNGAAAAEKSYYVTATAADNNTATTIASGTAKTLTKTKGSIDITVTYALNGHDGASITSTNYVSVTNFTIVLTA